MDVTIIFREPARARTISSNIDEINLNYPTVTKDVLLVHDTIAKQFFIYSLVDSEMRICITHAMLMQLEKQFNSKYLTWKKNNLENGCPYKQITDH